MLGLDNPIHLLFLGVLLLLVFGAKRLPEMGDSLGAGLRGFKDSLSADGDAVVDPGRRRVAAGAPGGGRRRQHRRAPARDSGAAGRLSASQRSGGHPDADAKRACAGSLAPDPHEERLSVVGHLDELRDAPHRLAAVARRRVRHLLLAEHPACCG